MDKEQLKIRTENSKKSYFIIYLYGVDPSAILGIILYPQKLIIKIYLERGQNVLKF